MSDVVTAPAAQVWRPESKAPEGEWVIARTVKQPSACTRPDERPSFEMKQAVKIGGVWWVFKDAHGRELTQACFRRTSLATASMYWPLNLGTIVSMPDEWARIPAGED